MLRSIIGFFSLMSVSAVVLSAGLQNNVSPPDVSRWKSDDQNISIELVQVNRDYARAVFYARGLPEDVVDEIGQYCVFGSIVKNLSKFPVTYRLSDWRVVTADGVEHKMKLKSEWIKEWSAKGVGFRWLLLADEQTFDEGDWIQGFTTIGLAPGQQFDLHYSWSLQGKTYRREFKGMQCAPVIPATP